MTDQPRHDATITLVDHSDQWATMFRWQAELIRSALGEVAVSVEHVGSTSVPGLPAKPIIDILLEVANPADEPAYVPALETLDYRLVAREPDWCEHRLLKHREPATNLHVLPTGCHEIERMLAFRDCLRRDPLERDRYLAVKRELAARKWAYVQDYADAKSAVVEDILLRALSRD
jgi:GrpB-like predicted nucleotidyltransferase (UPF0157 family)